MSREIKRVLVVRLGPIGEFVLSLAAMKRIRQAHPRARITLLTAAPFEALARSSPYFNEVDPSGEPGGIGEWLALRKRLRAERFDRVYDLECSRLSNSYFLMLRPFPPPWSGTARGCALPHRGRRRGEMHILERQAEQLRDAGIWPDAPVEDGSAPPPDLSWILRKHPDPRPVAGAPPPRPFVLLVPGGSAQRMDKRWPVERFAILARDLHEQGYDIVILGGPQESALARTIQRSATKARDLTGRTDFAQIAVLGARSVLAIGNDTGPMHLIAAAGAPTIVLSDRSEARRNAPRGHVTVLRAHTLDDLPVDEVRRAVANLLPSR